MAETINGLYKAELIHRRAPWKSKEAVELATLQWVAWFNNHRLMESLGYMPPAEAEANYCRQLAEADCSASPAAAPTPPSATGRGWTMRTSAQPGRLRRGQAGALNIKGENQPNTESNAASAATV